MALTPHQLLHINAIIDEAAANRLESPIVKEKIAESHNVHIDDYDVFWEEVGRLATMIRSSNIFIIGLETDSDIHDLLNRNLKFRVHG